jgi:hypothetical protein
MPPSADPGQPLGQRKDHASRGQPAAVSDRVSPKPAEGFARRELLWVSILCLLAAARVFFGAAALPIFADTDEDAHFDLIHKFSEGNWPSKLVIALDTETIKVLVLDSSPEFLSSPEECGEGPDYPLPVRMRLSKPETKRYINAVYSQVSRKANHEAQSPPVYYALAAVWYKFGHALGLTGAAAVYWVRFLNVPLYAALVAVAYAFCRPYFGHASALGIAALTTFFPNPVFFSISNDVLSPLVVLLTLLLSLRWYESERPGIGLAAAAGAMAATSVLVKLTNGSALAAAGVVVLMRLWRDRRPVKLLSEAWPLLLSAAVPLILWGVRNQLVFKDWSGANGRMLVRGLKLKPPGELLHHPIFTVGGLSTFLKALGSSMYAGDINWCKQIVHFVPSQVFYMFTTPLLPVIGLAATVYYGRREPRARLAALMCALVVIASVGELAALSLRFDFGEAQFPSKQLPYYAFGRLAAGGLVPFLALYALGTRAIVGRVRSFFAAMVTAEVVMMILGQWALLKLVVGSQYNWFHLH